MSLGTPVEAEPHVGELVGRGKGAEADEADDVSGSAGTARAVCHVKARSRLCLRSFPLL